MAVKTTKTNWAMAIEYSIFISEIFIKIQKLAQLQMLKSVT